MSISPSANADQIAQALDSLADLVRQKRIVPGALFWNGTEGSVAGAMIRGDDPALWEAKLGLAAWLAYALDAVVSLAGEPSDAVTVSGQLLGSLPPQAQTLHLGGACIRRVLALCTQALDDHHEPAPELRALIDDLQHMHQAAVSDAATERRTWSELRRRAGAICQSAKSSALSVIGACVEAACWNPVAWPNTVGEVLRAWMSADVALAELAWGWTAADHDLIQRLLDQLYEEHLMDKPESANDVFTLLRQHHPDIETRLLAFTQAQAGFRSSASLRAPQILASAMHGEMTQDVAAMTLGQRLY